MSGWPPLHPMCEGMTRGRGRRAQGVAFASGLLQAARAAPGFLAAAGNRYRSRQSAARIACAQKAGLGDLRRSSRCTVTVPASSRSSRRPAVSHQPSASRRRPRGAVAAGPARPQAPNMLRVLAALLTAAVASGSRAGARPPRGWAAVDAPTLPHPPHHEGEQPLALALALSPRARRALVRQAAAPS
jgi:hypothetical protein